MSGRTMERLSRESPLIAWSRGLRGVKTFERGSSPPLAVLGGDPTAAEYERFSLTGVSNCLILPLSADVGAGEGEMELACDWVRGVLWSETKEVKLLREHLTDWSRCRALDLALNVARDIVLYLGGRSRRRASGLWCQESTSMLSSRGRSGAKRSSPRWGLQLCRHRGEQSYSLRWLT